MVFRKRHHVEDEDTDEEDVNIDPDLRLRTVRTAASTIAESNRAESRAEQRRTQRRKRGLFTRKSKERLQKPEEGSASASAPAAQITGKRRKVYVNMPLTAMEVDQEGEPTVRYVRNKVRTSKYTVLTFIPKNLYEQYGRVANIYFLALVVAQVFPVFGAASPQISMLPLVFILTVTAIKDGVEDYRRATLDEEVNTSAATKLGRWKNVNQPSDARSALEKLLGLNAPGAVSKGVRRLREREAGAARIVLARADEEGTVKGGRESNATLGRLEDIQSVDESHIYPPGIGGPSSVSLMESVDARSTHTRTSNQWGVLDFNRRPAGTAQWERTLWKKLEVGDVVLLRENEQVPADIVVLATSDPDGTCYLETKNLDGETNLKPRKACKATAAMCSEEDIERASFVLDSEPPHQNLYLYNGVLRYQDPISAEQKQESVTINELLLRGCMVRNTTWIIGLVVFTGADTKIMLNGGETPSKRSKIEKETNFNVVMNFIILLLMCAFSAVGSGIMDDKQDTSSKFFEHGADATDSAALNSLVTFVSCLIAFQNIVPISLYISIEIVKTIQAYFISQDIDMYYEPFDTTCVPKTWNISDDLGQIEYIFSDKTGTLTQNVMEFQKCSINGVVYGETITEAQRGAARREGRDVGDPEEHAEKMKVMKSAMLERMTRLFKNKYAQTDKLTLIAPNLAEDLADRSREQRGHIIAFFRALAVCHSVLADRPEPQTRPFFTNYKAESPDESALVAAARDIGFPFVNKAKDFLDIEVMGQPERYVLLKTLEFNSTRKRMSVIVRNPEGKLVLYCKGADSVIYERLAPDHDKRLKEETTRDMEAFANGGLRTLCIAHRYLSEDEYFQWSRVYDAATSAIKDRDEEIDKATEQIEHSLRILGATALEDKLQEGVPDAIEILHKAGIKLWILTGDKVQTAIEIGFSCNLLKSEMDIMILSADSATAARAQIEAGLNKIASVLGPPSMDPKQRGFLPNAKASFAVVIDGDTLRHAFDPALKPLFLNLATQCETVVCCRVSPAQKALTVKLVKEGRNAMTLSIGDGANDVAMIQEANIGCGLFGLEGSQAAMSADYAFGQFRFLTKLLIVHGRWSYQRIADMHSNFFYKNVIWTFAMFWYLPWNSFDATYLYQYTFILLYNLVFTSLPVIVLGAFDQDLNAKAALAFPQLYVRGIRGLEYTRTKFWLYMLDGLYQSAVVYFAGYAVWTLGPAVSWNGRAMDSLADFGTTVSVAAIFAANVFVGMNTHYWTLLTWLVVIGSSLVMVIWIAIYSLFESPDFVDEVFILYGGITFWATVILAVTVALAPHFLFTFFCQAYAPLDKEIVREAWVVGDLKEQLGIKHRRHQSGRDAEGQAMYTNVHLRSESEMSVGGRIPYEPVHLGSPGRSPGSTPGRISPKSPGSSTVVGYNDTPRSGMMALGYSDNPQMSGERDEGQYVTVPSQRDAYGQYASTSHSPNPYARSPVPSYYSANDIPIPSPVPPSVWSPTTGSPRSPGQPTIRSPGRIHTERSRSPRGDLMSPTSPHTLQVPGSAGYEMNVRRTASDPSSSPTDHDRIRSPRSPPPDRHDLSRASEFSNASFTTAREASHEAWSGDEDERADHARRASYRSAASTGTAQDGLRPESYVSTASTVRGQPRPESYQSYNSWTPRAI